MEHAQSNQIKQWINNMNCYNATPGEGTTRISLTPIDLQNRKYVKQEMKKLGLEIREDAVGNLFGIYPGENRNLPPVWTGSHIDTVLHGGKFDGMAGVAAALEAIRILYESGRKTKRDIAIVAFTSEEPTAYGLSCLGSRALAGKLSASMANELKDQYGVSLYESLSDAGYPVKEWEVLPIQKGEVHSFVELHIEQNCHLEKEQKKIGIVKKICAPSTYQVCVSGIQDHAGGTDMNHRKDAYTASCEMALALEKIAQECPSEYNTATIGMVEVAPGSINVIPGKCTFTVDIRDCDMNTKSETISQFQKKFADIARRRGVEVEIKEINNENPVVCDKEIGDYMRQFCKSMKISYMDLISGPYHDSNFVSYFTNVAMIFVPSKKGISHSPDEWTDYEDIALGTDVLVNTLIHLANE